MEKFLRTALASALLAIASPVYADDTVADLQWAGMNLRVVTKACEIHYGYLVDTLKGRSTAFTLEQVLANVKKCNDDTREIALEVERLSASLADSAQD